MDMLVVAKPWEMAVQASEDDVRTASAWLEAACGEAEIPAEQLYRLDLCLNEALANIIFHGGPSARKSPVALSLCVGGEAKVKQARLSVSDAGMAFNPLTAPAAEQATLLTDAVPGGLGLTMIKCYSDRLEYAFLDGRNQLSFIFEWPVA